MSQPTTLPVTQLLRAWMEGESPAFDQVMALVYDELRRRAHHYMARERPGISWQPTAVVNEVYLRMVKTTGIYWQDRAHFLAIAAQMMRRILVDAARTRFSAKRGGAARRIPLDERTAAGGRDAELLALDDALGELSRKDARKARVVELRFFGGLSVQETAEALQVSEDTVGRDWNFAKAWLAREMR